jgi:excisionase family DNA binding protein
MSGSLEQESAALDRKRRKLRKGVQPAEEFLTVSQVAENWQVSPRTVRRMIADGRLQVVRLGRAVRIPSKAHPY